MIQQLHAPRTRPVRHIGPGVGDGLPRFFRLVELQVCQGIIQEKNIVVGIGVEKAWVLLGMTWECFVGKPKRAQRLLLLSYGGLSRFFFFKQKTAYEITR